ncbi:MAG TPA: cytochrome d ubiquinol oxidase subunit II [Pseudonocardia sp.]
MLQTLPLLYTLAGLVLYTVLAGADFGAGIWQLSAFGRGTARQVREHAHHANAPVWEANHVWLIFALVMLWTAYPTFLGSVASTAIIPLGLALVGIIFRGLGYTLQGTVEHSRQRAVIDNVFAFASLLTPFMLTTVLGALASDRIPVGNATGDPVTSWLNPTSVLCGTLGLGVSAYLAAVYLAADAARMRSASLVAAFRRRAIATGVLTGVLSVAGLPILAHDAHRVYLGLTSGWGLAALVVTVASGAASLVLVLRNTFQAARLVAAAAVAALLVGWAAAERPYLLPGLTLPQAASGTATLVALTVAVLVGGALLAPSLLWLFRLTLAGRFDAHSPAHPAPAQPPPVHPRPAKPAHHPRIALSALLIGLLLLTVADGAAAHTIGVISLAIAACTGFATIDPTRLAAGQDRRT